MGFLNWWKEQEAEEDSQLSLLGDQPLAPHNRVNGATVYQDFSQAIHNKGGDGKTIARAVGAETRELFDCSVDELYRETGGTKKDRSSLPAEAQKAYMVSETLSAHRLNDTDIEGNQQQKDTQIVDTVADTAKETRKWFPW